MGIILLRKKEGKRVLGPTFAEIPKWRGWAAGGILLLYLLIPFGLRAEAAENGEKGLPKIKVIPEKFDLGWIPQVKTKRSFLIRNVGDAPLQIYHIFTSCSCTTAFIDQRLIGPGKSATLVVTYDPNFHRSLRKPEWGREVRAIYIRSNDPQMPEKVVHITVMKTG